MALFITNQKKQIRTANDALTKPRPTQLGDMEEITKWDAVNANKNQTVPNLWELYVKSRTNKILGYVEHMPLKSETFDLNKIQETPIDQKLLDIIEPSGIHLAIEDIVKKVLKGSCLAMAIKVNDKQTYFKVLEQKEYDASYFLGMPTEYYVSTEIRVPDEWECKKPIRYSYKIADKQAKLVQARPNKSNNADEYMALSGQELKDLGMATGTFDASFVEFKLNNEKESLFKPLEDTMKGLFQQYSKSWNKDLITSEAGLILNAKAFTAGALTKFMEKYTDTSSSDFNQTEDSMVKFVVPQTNALGVQAFDIWSPQPKSGEYQKEVKDLFMTADEALRMHQTIGNDGKSNNKTAGQSSSFNVMFHTFCIDFCRKISIYFKTWMKGIGEMYGIKNIDAMIAVSIVIQQQMKTAFESDNPFNPLGDGKAGQGNEGEPSVE